MATLARQDLRFGVCHASTSATPAHSAPGVSISLCSRQSSPLVFAGSQDNRAVQVGDGSGGSLLRVTQRLLCFLGLCNRADDATPALTGSGDVQWHCINSGSRRRMLCPVHCDNESRPPRVHAKTTPTPSIAANPSQGEAFRYLVHVGLLITRTSRVCARFSSDSGRIKSSQTADERCSKPKLRKRSVWGKLWCRPTLTATQLVKSIYYVRRWRRERVWKQTFSDPNWPRLPRYEP